MKKVLIVLMLLICCSIPCFASSWYYVGNCDDGAQIYIDNASVVKSDSAASVWIKFINADGSYDLTRVDFLHTERQVSEENYYKYDANGSIIESHDDSTDYGAIMPDSAYELVYQSIWG